MWRRTTCHKRTNVLEEPNASIFWRRRQLFPPPPRHGFYQLHVVSTHKTEIVIFDTRMCCEDSRLLACYAESTGKLSPTFLRSFGQRNSSRRGMIDENADGLLYAEDVSNKILPNGGIFHSTPRNVPEHRGVNLRSLIFIAVLFGFCTSYILNSVLTLNKLTLLWQNTWL
jgi:hypothetical protein